MDKLRDFMKSWPGKIILLLCLAPMVLLGLDSYFGGARMSPDTVARVGEQDISLRNLQQELQNTRSDLIAQVDASAIDQSALQEQVLDNVINRALIQEQSRALGMKFSDATVSALLAQQSNFLDANGQFSNELFVNYLKQSGQTRDSLIQSFGADLAMRQLMTGVLSTAIYPSSQVDRLIDLQLMSRDVWVKRLAWQDYAKQVTIGEQEINAYFEAHKDSPILISPETVDLAYIILPRQLDSTDAISDDEIKTAYENYLQANGYGEQKQIAQILITGDNATGRIAAIKAELDKGADFGELAKTHSDDPTGKSGGNIGTFNPAVFGADAAKVTTALAGLKKGQVSDAVITSFGTHLFKVIDVASMHEAPSMESIKDALVRELQDDKARAALAEQVTNINNMTLDELSLTDIAKHTGLKVHTIKGYPKKNNRTALPQPAVIAAAFDEILLLDQRVSTDIELPNAIVWVQSSNHKAQASMTKEQAHPVIKAELTREAAIKLALADAETLAKEVTKDTLIQMTALGKLSRAVANDQLHANETSSLFSHDADGISAWAVATDDGASILAGSAIIKETEARMPPAQKEATAAMMKDVLGQDYLADYLIYLRSVHPIEINRDALGNTAGQHSM